MLLRKKIIEDVSTHGAHTPVFDMLLDMDVRRLGSSDEILLLRPYAIMHSFPKCAGLEDCVAQQWNLVHNSVDMASCKGHFS